MTKTAPVTASRIPILETLRSYRLGDLGSDASAGIAIAAVGLPSAIAYPAIAGLPPETGLYASILRPWDMRSSGLPHDLSPALMPRP